MPNDTVVTGTVISKTKGGLIANVFGLETFLPGSQIDVKPIVDYDSYVGMTMEFKVVKINEAIKNAVVSHKALIESDLEEQRQTHHCSIGKRSSLGRYGQKHYRLWCFHRLGRRRWIACTSPIFLGDVSTILLKYWSMVRKLNVVVIEFDDAKKAYFSWSQAADSTPMGCIG